MTVDSFIREDEIRPLTAVDVDRAAAVVGQMAGIPALQGGFADFNEHLDCLGWAAAPPVAAQGAIVVTVPKPDASLDERHRLVRAGIEEHCRELEDDEHEERDRREFARQAEMLRAAL